MNIYRPTVFVQTFLLICGISFALWCCEARLIASSTASQDSVLPESSGTITIEPMTNVVPTSDTGYFSDPSPIKPWLSKTEPGNSQSFSGTTKGILHCTGDIQAGCFEEIPLTITFGDLQSQASAGGAVIMSSANHNIYRDSKGRWHMATVLKMVRKKVPQQNWNVIAHAHPNSETPDIPTRWTVDTVLVGSLTTYAPANYSGHYYRDGGLLYLTYVKSLADSELGVVAQIMASPTRPASVEPTVLIRPEEHGPGFNSEFRNGLNPNNPLKLIETGNVTRIEGKYLLAYSVGAFNLPDYKIGFAWSDTFLPMKGSHYKKILKNDTAGVWGQPNHQEVLYFLQSQESAWPNYVANQVIAPGVPDVQHDSNDNWFLFFAGYDPSDTPTKPGTKQFVGSHRRPYFVRLRINIPPGTTVGETSSHELANWITSQ